MGEAGTSLIRGRLRCWVVTALLLTGLFNPSPAPAGSAETPTNTPTATPSATPTDTPTPTPTDTPEPTQACCLPDGTCAELTELDCVDSGGALGGLDSTCANTPCGACCLPDPDELCLPLSEDLCEDAGGTFEAGTSCAESSCPVDCCSFGAEGPECSEDGTLAECENVGGSAFPRGACELGSCGACCLLEGGGCRPGIGPNTGPFAGLCSDSAEFEKPGFLDPGKTCDEADCGACCGVAASCIPSGNEQCTDAGGTFDGSGTSCDDVTCPLCCRCVGDATECQEQPCSSSTSADIGECFNECTELSCVTAIATADCEGEDCPTTGCCQFSGSCFLSDEAACNFPGVSRFSFVPGATCQPEAGGCFLTPTPTSTSTATPTVTPTGTATDTPSPKSTSAATDTPTVTPTPTPTNTPLPDGAPCTDPIDCVSGNCVDDVCCNEPCTGPDQLCNLQGNVGMCTDVAAPAPTTSRTGLLIGLGILAAVAAVALWRRRELKHYLWSV